MIEVSHGNHQRFLLVSCAFYHKTSMELFLERQLLLRQIANALLRCWCEKEFHPVSFAFFTTRNLRSILVGDSMTLIFSNSIGSVPKCSKNRRPIFVTSRVTFRHGMARMPDALWSLTRSMFAIAWEIVTRRRLAQLSPKRDSKNSRSNPSAGSCLCSRATRLRKRRSRRFVDT